MDPLKPNMRDKFKNVKYFEELIDKRYKIIEKSKSNLNSGLTNSNRAQSVKKSLSDKYVSLIKAKYSRGDNLTYTINQDFNSAVSLMSEYWEKNHLGINFYLKNGTPKYLKQYTLTSYLNILDLLSIGVLVEGISNEYLKMIEDFIDKDEVKDYLFEFLINYWDKERPLIYEESYEDLFLINERFGRLKKVIKERNKETAQKEIAYFLNKEWYDCFKGTPIYNQHLNKHNTYVGYWCFVAAAIVKIKDLDDSSFRNNEYYPKDLV